MNQKTLALFNQGFVPQCWGADSGPKAGNYWASAPFCTEDVAREAAPWVQKHLPQCRQVTIEQAKAALLSCFVPQDEALRQPEDLFGLSVQVEGAWLAPDGGYVVADSLSGWLVYIHPDWRDVDVLALMKV